MADSRGEDTVLLSERKLGPKDALQEAFLRMADHACGRRTGKRDWALAEGWMKTQLEMGGFR